MKSLWRSLLTAIMLTSVAGCTPNAPSTGGPSLTTVSPAATATAKPAPSPRPAVSNGTITIELFEWSIPPEPFHLPPGSYKAEVINRGRRGHDLVVAAENEVQTRRLGPGQTQTINFVLKPGETTIWCSIDDHRDMGMEAYLQVD